MACSRRIRIALLVVPLLGWGCAPPIPSGGFQGPDPASRIYAAVGVAQEFQRTGEEPPPAILRDLVQMLVSADPAERLVASDTLRLVTDRNFGYLPYAPLPERRVAAERWSKWVDSLTPDATSGTSAT